MFIYTTTFLFNGLVLISKKFSIFFNYKKLLNMLDRLKQSQHQNALSRLLYFNKFAELYNLEYLHNCFIYANDLDLSILLAHTFVEEHDLPNAGTRNGFQIRNINYYILCAFFYYWVECFQKLVCLFHIDIPSKGHNYPALTFNNFYIHVFSPLFHPYSIIEKKLLCNIF